MIEKILKSRFSTKDLEIYELRKQGWTLRKIAKKYGISAEWVRLTCNKITFYKMHAGRVLSSLDINENNEYIGELGFSKRVVKTLENNGIYTWDQLKECSYDEIINMGGSGKAGSQEIFRTVFERLRNEKK